MSGLWERRLGATGVGGWPLLALVLAPAALASAALAQPLTLEPAWGGRFAPGYPTELGVTLVSPVGGTALISAGSGTDEVRTRTLVEAGQPARLTLPLTPGRDGTLSVVARLPDGDQANAEVTLTPLPSGPAPASTLATTDAASTLTTDPGQLPRHPWGYGPVAAISLGPADLQRLDGPQTAALAAYLAQCRPLHLLGASDEALAGIRRAAGCSGVAVDAGEPPAIGAAALPGDGPLAALTPQASGGATLALLLLPYPIFLLTLAWRPRVGPWLLAVPAGAALAYGLALPWGVPTPQVTVWSETNAGDPSSRYAALVELAGGGSPAGLAIPGATRVRPLDGGGLALSVAADGALTLDPPGGLLQARRYRVEGTGQVPPRISLAATAPGTMTLDNAGSEATAAGWLLWQGVAHPVPTMAPGRHTLTVTGPAVPPPVPQALAARAGQGPALLLPGGSPIPGTSTAWLLVRSGETPP